MHVEKKSVARLTKCYSIGKIHRDGTAKYLVASEKQHQCLQISYDGLVEEVVWEGPGGVMTIEPLDGGNGAFLATQRFYSPNDAANVSIVLARPTKDGWQVNTICELPFVHRFGIIGHKDHRYLVAATLKSAHAFKEDWTCPGRVWAAKLPADLLDFDAQDRLEMKPVVSGLYHNHGFFKVSEENGTVHALFGTDNGIFMVVAPESDDDKWTVEKVLDIPTSDMLEVDLDGDGQKELLVFEGFHGNVLSVFKKDVVGYKRAFTFQEELPFLHALAVGKLDGREVAVIGHRGGKRQLLMISGDTSGYRYDVLDSDIGPANVYCEEMESGLRIVAANREIDEIAIYTVTASAE